MTSSSHPTVAGRVLAVLPPALVAAVAAGYLGLGLWGQDLPAEVPGDVPPVVHATLVLLQAVALLRRRRSPVVVLAVAVVADLVVLATTGGELGIGALAVMVAAYGAARRGGAVAGPVALVAGAAATALVGAAAMAAGPDGDPTVLVSTAVARVGLLYAAPAAVAQYAKGRERLAEQVRDQERTAEAQRRYEADRQVRAERAALARELHDIAGHHLSGIVVGAQAASALLVSDPERARDMLRTVQDDARITLGDLRRTVGLLRDDDDAPGPAGRPAVVPTLAAVDGLVGSARDRGQEVDLLTTGTARPLGPLAEATAYRTVQESLANAARHAPGARTAVTVAWADDVVEVAVRNGPPTTRPVASPSRPSRGYGLAGMAERAELVGAELTTGPSEDGGWRTVLTLPATAAVAP